MTYTKYPIVSARMIVVVFVAFLLNVVAAMEGPEQPLWDGIFFEDALPYAETALELTRDAGEVVFQAAVARASTSPRTTAIIGRLLPPWWTLENWTPLTAEEYMQHQPLDVPHYQLPNDVTEPATPFQYPSPIPPEPQAYYPMPKNRFLAPLSKITDWMSGTYTPTVHFVNAPAALPPQQPLHPTHWPSTTATIPNTQSSFPLLAPASQTPITPNTSVSSHRYPCNHANCNASCATRAALKKHKKSHIPVANRKHGCPAETCSKRFNEKKDLVKHQLTHDKDHTMRFACPQLDCERHTKLIVRWDNFLRHMEDIHEIVLPRKTKTKKAKDRQR
ncbi:hypothetical protein B0A48_12066 [Cryoendolithus antarcticus]|uniref:C2H2 type master regulator of conidiophore development brlA n=1 Tax=Cryoendolithus antarcticus TaxID=1507870 RepID=A0A1V8STZ6_9PEZI|nr:hypothetical protein B0A48_12066 [Cryoendolithus antarcticus]